MIETTSSLDTIISSSVSKPTKRMFFDTELNILSSFLLLLQNLDTSYSSILISPHNSLTVSIISKSGSLDSTKKNKKIRGGQNPPLTFDYLMIS